MRRTPFFVSIRAHPISVANQAYYKANSHRNGGDSGGVLNKIHHQNGFITVPSETHGTDSPRVSARAVSDSELFRSALWRYLLRRAVLCMGGWAVP